ncbi:MAG: hypothetical protein HYZ44_10200 [Bacteroidetes bacterium]|nr:hypothetical protein [Bacteroidota bacterium]
MEPYEFVIEKEFQKIYQRFEADLTERCLDLHAIGLATMNFPDMKVIKFPNPFITYYLKDKVGSSADYFSAYTKHNNEAIIKRVNNFYVMNILSSAELHLKEALSLLRSLLEQTKLNFPTDSFKAKFAEEIEARSTFGKIYNEIIETVNKVSGDIIPDGSPQYRYLKNYILLRNCLAHKGGKISGKEIGMEIRIPFIDETQIQEAIKPDFQGSLTPQTAIIKWELNQQIGFHINEVEGIAYGLTKTLHEIITHVQSS